MSSFRCKHVLTSALSRRGTEENFWGWYLDCMGNGPAFPRRRFAASSEPAMPCAVGHCQGEEPHRHWEDKDISPDILAKSGFKWVTMSNCRSCASAHVPRESDDREHWSPLSAIILLSSTLLLSHYWNVTTDRKNLAHKFYALRMSKLHTIILSC
jgi:hypothetical protein